MCKHILFNEFGLDDIATLKQFVSLTHDHDGFGAIIRTNRNEIETLKSLNSGEFYIDLMNRIHSGNIQTLVVHHRTSTNKDGLEYAHPFEFRGNFLTHNGVVSVPGKHDTKTENDSEALLHHLIKTNFETVSIEGYFSCFIMNERETIVLVDRTAPIYSNGRIYSSHNLGNDFIKIEKKLLRIEPLTSNILSKEEIEVTESTYGSNLSHLSLGSCETYTVNDDGFYSTDALSAQVVDFFDLIRDDELNLLSQYRDTSSVKTAILELSYAFGLDLTDADLEQIFYCL